MMPERMDWSSDERLYQPRIHSRYIRELHRISEATGKPMTVLVNLAMNMLVETYSGETQCPEAGNGDGAALPKPDDDAVQRQPTNA